MSLLKRFADSEHALRAISFEALAFISPQDVIKWFKDFVDTFCDYDEQRLYFKTPWIEKLRHRNRRQPLHLFGCRNVFHGFKMICSRTTALKCSRMRSESAFQSSIQCCANYRQESHTAARMQRNYAVHIKLYVEQIKAGVVGFPRKKRCYAANPRLKRDVRHNRLSPIHLPTQLK